MAANTTFQCARDLMTFSSALLRYFPLAAARWRLGQGDKKATADAAWKVYDAGIRAATTDVDDLYRTPLFSETVSSGVNHWLRWRRMSNALNRVLLSSFWPMLGLPTAAEIQSLTAQVRALEAPNESIQPSPRRASPMPCRPEEPFADGIACSERRKEQPQEARTAA